MVLKELRRAVIICVTYVTVYSVAVVITGLLFLYTIYDWFRSPSGAFVNKRRELPPSCLNDPEYGKHCYIQIKNIKLHYVENGDKSKPLMLFLHGFPEFWYSWRYQIKHFSKYYWVVALDLRGYGDSEKPTGVSQYNLNYLANDVKNFVNALGKDKCILVGHDWGGILGWYVISKYPELIEKYVILNIPPIFSVQNNWKQLLKSWYVSFFLLPYVPEFYLSTKDFVIFDVIFRKENKEDIEAYKFTFGKPGAFTYVLNYYRANFKNFLSYKSLKKKLDNDQLPTGLLIYTDNDRFIDVSNFTRATKMVRNLQMSFIKRGTHFLHQHKHDEVNQEISKFLRIESEDHGQGKSVQSDDAKA